MFSVHQPPTPTATNTNQAVLGAAARLRADSKWRQHASLIENLYWLTTFSMEPYGFLYSPIICFLRNFATSIACAISIEPCCDATLTIFVPPSPIFPPPNQLSGLAIASIPETCRISTTPMSIKVLSCPCWNFSLKGS